MEGAGIGEFIFQEEGVGSNVPCIFRILGVRFHNFKVAADGFRVASQKISRDSEHSVVNKDVQVSTQEKVFVGVDDGLWGFTKERHVEWLVEERKNRSVEQKEMKKDLNKWKVSQIESESKKIDSGPQESDI